MTSIYEEKPWLKLYPEGVSWEVDCPAISLGEAFDRATEKWAGKTAVIFYGSKISYKELRQRVDRLATALVQKLGVAKGDRVGLLLLNSPEYLISFYACVKIGAVVTPISPVYVSSEIKHQLQDSGARTLICQDILFEGVEKSGVKLQHVVLTNISESLPKLKRMMGQGILRGVYQKMAAPPPEILTREGMHQLQDLIGSHPAEPPKVDIDPQKDLVVLPYTGGTTGPPKGVMITHANTVANVHQVCQYQSILEEGKENLIAYMPYYHAAGQSIGVLMGVLQGFTQVTITTPELDDILTSLVKHRATVFVGAPTMYEMLKDYDKTDRVPWKKFKAIWSGADSLHEETGRDWELRTGTTIGEGYGMTETTATTHMEAAGREKPGAIGFPIPGTVSAILDPEEDKFVPVGELGEIATMGPQVTTAGYWQRPEVTKECEAIIDGKRWWRTGDLGRMDEDGYFYVYDRKRDLIKYKGLRVFAREVEEVLKTHPDVKEVGVVGVPDLLVGENVKAIIVLEGDARGKTSEADITEFCKDKLAHYKIPRTIEFVGEIPKTDIGKVSRREIRSMDEEE
ncbi:MAG: AMP-binding protein [Proteobacteria bacterium]|nr:AMP-binding protein [Pseudomonadota bacterium]MBU4575035.1 AMP-binding protein [Pseudomonadota bacterium]MBU4598744.1 AMP-binding protein [Pseudomonadota bacterium]